MKSETSCWSGSCLDKLSTNGSAILWWDGNLSPFALSLSKGERRDVAGSLKKSV